MRFATLLALMAIVPACFNPDDKGAADADTEGGTGGATEGNSDSETATGGGQTDSDSSDPSTDTDPTTSSDPTGNTTDGVCGDGELNGDESCDDGVNDGSYGSCLEDCSGMAGFCGDAEVNGPEACDDGVNDGSYGGCTAECAAGPSCGDGEVNGPELCDNGPDNENASGCNVDCTTSGTAIGELLQTGLSFCDGAFTTPTQFTAEENALVTATGYCPNDTQLLQELTPDLEVVQEFDVLLPGTPLREATMLGDRWLLASNGCNYVIDGGGGYGEFCETERITGYGALHALDEDRYAGLDYNEVALYGAGSPSMGDAFSWMHVPPEPGFYEYSWRTMVVGPNGSVIVGGMRTNTTDSTSIGYFVQYTSAGNTADTNTYNGIVDIDLMASGPDGSLLLYTAGQPAYPDGVITKLNAAFGQDWTLPVTAPGDIQMAFDSAGDVVLLHEDGNQNGSYELRKLNPDDTTELWSLPIPGVSYEPRIAIAPDDYIWVSSAGYGGEGGQFLVVRVSP